MKHFRWLLYLTEMFVTWTTASDLRLVAISFIRSSYSEVTCLMGTLIMWVVGWGG